MHLDCSPPAWECAESAMSALQASPHFPTRTTLCYRQECRAPRERSGGGRGRRTEVALAVRERQAHVGQQLVDQPPALVLPGLQPHRHVAAVQQRLAHAPLPHQREAEVLAGPAAARGASFGCRRMQAASAQGGTAGAGAMQGLPRRAEPGLAPAACRLPSTQGGAAGAGSDAGPAAARRAWAARSARGCHAGLSPAGGQGAQEQRLGRPGWCIHAFSGVMLNTARACCGLGQATCTLAPPARLITRATGDRLLQELWQPP